MNLRELAIKAFEEHEAAQHKIAVARVKEFNEVQAERAFHALRDVIGLTTVQAKDLPVQPLAKAEGEMAVIENMEFDFDGLAVRTVNNATGGDTGAIQPDLLSVLCFDRIEGETSWRIFSNLLELGKLLKEDEANRLAWEEVL